MLGTVASSAGCPRILSPLPSKSITCVPRNTTGPPTAGNLAWTCFPCNNHKGPNLAGIDANTGNMARLFSPRDDRWEEHFAWDGPHLLGMTAIGRATIDVLGINVPDRVALRQELIAEGVFPSAQP